MLLSFFLNIRIIYQGFIFHKIQCSFSVTDVLANDFLIQHHQPSSLPPVFLSILEQFFLAVLFFVTVAFVSHSVPPVNKDLLKTASCIRVFLCSSCAGTLNQLEISLLGAAYSGLEDMRQICCTVCSHFVRSKRFAISARISAAALCEVKGPRTKQ